MASSKKQIVVLGSGLVEKTLRYPGTVGYLQVLRELGYFSKEEVEVTGYRIRPVDLTVALLFPWFRLEKGEGISVSCLSGNCLFLHGSNSPAINQLR